MKATSTPIQEHLRPLIESVKAQNDRSSEPIQQEFDLNKDRFSGGGIQTNRELEDQSIINKDLSADLRQAKSDDFVGVQAEIFLDGSGGLKQEFKNSINAPQDLGESLLSQSRPSDP